MLTVLKRIPMIFLLVLSKNSVEIFLVILG